MSVISNFFESISFDLISNFIIKTILNKGEGFNAYFTLKGKCRFILNFKSVDDSEVSTDGFLIVFPLKSTKIQLTIKIDDTYKVSA